MDWLEAKDLLLKATMGGFLAFVGNEFRRTRQEIGQAVQSVESLNRNIGKILIRLENHEVRINLLEKEKP